MNDKPVGSQLALEQRARKAFAHSVAELDAPTLAGLTRARRRALGGLETPRPVLFAGRAPWIAAGVAAAIALSFAWLLPDNGPQAPQRAVPLAASPDGELLLSQDELDMIQDLDFYSWLDAQARREPPRSSDGGIG